MDSNPNDANPDYTKLLEQLDIILGHVGRGYSDWLELWWNSLPPDVEDKAEELTNQFEKLTSDMYLFVKNIQEIANE